MSTQSQPDDTSAQQPFIDEPAVQPEEIVPDEPELEEDAEAAGPGLLVRCTSELFGTFVLVFAGVGVAIYGQLSNAAGALPVALAFGLAVIVGATVVGHISGAHFNSAITLGAAIGGRLPWRDVLPYWLSQVVGALLAGAVLLLTVPEGVADLLRIQDGRRGVIGTAANGFDSHSPLAHLLANNGIDSDVTFSIAAALLVEVVLTGILVAVFLAATRRAVSSTVAPYAIGLTLAVGLLIAAPVTNGSLNPARSTATAIFGPSWALGQLWLFWVAPLLGAAVAALLYRAFAPAPAELADEVDEGPDEAESGEVDVLPSR